MTEHKAHLAQHIDLQDLNTFALHSLADNYVDVTDVNHLKNLCQQQHPRPYWIIGGGSNVLLQPHIKGTVWHMNLKGIELLREDAEHAHIKVSAGENWHQFVLHTLSKNYYGLENLSLIPGSVGGAPVQNIGAYGVEVADFITEVTAINLTDGQIITLSNHDCQFAYRDSCFKHEPFNRNHLITDVTFKLHQTPRLKIDYAPLNKALSHIKQPTPNDVSQAVIHIRQNKLPDPATTPNAGSFFKNPVIDELAWKILQKKYPNCPHYTQTNGIKIPAGWLIEQCGFKQSPDKHVSCYPTQALVLTHDTHATYQDIIDFATRIQLSVKNHFDITLEREVRSMPPT